MKPITIALIVAVLHRVAVYLTFGIGFGFEMTAFNGNSPLVGLGSLLVQFSKLLDFPVFALSYFAFQAKHGYFPQGGVFGFYQNELPLPLLWSLGWSLCVGSVVGVLVFFYRRHKP